MVPGRPGGGARQPVRRPVQQTAAAGRPAARRRGGLQAVHRLAVAAILVAVVGLLSGSSQLSASRSAAAAASIANAAAAASIANPVEAVDSDDAGTLNGHPVALDGTGALISWLPPTGWFDQVITRAWRFLSQVPQAVQAEPFDTSIPILGGDGQTHPAFYFYSFFVVNSIPFEPAPYKHNPAGLYSMIIDSALAYYPYSGDAGAIGLATQVLDYDLAYGLTADAGAWPQVPYASAEPGAPIYRGVAEGLVNGAGDGTGYIEPDKVGEWGYSVLRFYEQTGNPRYLAAARHAAVALARNVRLGDAAHSPWPFRVNALDNVTLTPARPMTGATSEEYCADVIGPVRLLDELIRLGIGDLPLFQRARQIAWSWLMAYPMKNGQWANYFEDIPTHPLPDGTRYRMGISSTNVNQYSPMETARYLIEHPETDANWMADSQHLLNWVERYFAHRQYGVNAIGEQVAYDYPMGSHTARYASVSAMYSEKGVESPIWNALQNAQGAFAWASYMLNEDGSVTTGPDPQVALESWFSDGYGDYIRHFLAGVGAYPLWAAGTGNHLLRSTSVVQSIDYAPGQIKYTTYDPAAQEVLNLDFAPSSVVSTSGENLPYRGDPAAPGWEMDDDGAGSYTVRIWHLNSRDITIAR
jgi:hypothetical protein